MAEPLAALRAEIARLQKVVLALMNRAERASNLHGSDFSLFQSNVMLEAQVRARTADLENALRDNEQIQRALRESEAKYRAVVEQSLIGITVTEDGRFSYVNARFGEMFGYLPEEILRLDPLELVMEARRASMAEQFALDVSSKAEQIHYLIEGRRKDGEQVDAEIFSNIIHVNGRRLRVSLVHDVTERCRVEREVLALHERLREQSLRDPLTGLHNRRFLEENLPRELARAMRQCAPVAVVLGDIDHFKAINDRYGHPAGDQVLREFATLLGHAARESDLCCRLGGEEFLLILPGLDQAGATARAEQLRLAVETAQISWQGAPIPITASFGIAIYPEHGQLSEPLIAAADAALYMAKGCGRNRVCSA